MEAEILTLLNSVVQSGSITESGLSLIIIGLILAGYKFIFKPIYNKISDIPSLENVKSMVDECNEIEKFNINELTKKIEKIEETLSNITNLDKGSYRELKEIKTDIEYIKQILNQFQGHLMYSGGRRTSDFGNRELR